MIFWASQTLSVAGSSITLVAMPLLILRATGSVAQMGILTGLSTVGTVLTGVFAGSVVDRFDRRTLMIAADLVRAVLFALVPAIWFFGAQPWLLYVVMPLGAVFDMVFQVTYVTAVANLVDRDEVTEANGRLQTTFGILYVLGPVAAAGLAAWVGPANALGLDALSFVASALGLCLIRLRPVASVVEEGTPLRRLLAGARFLWQQPVLRSLTILLTGILFLILGAVDVLIYYLKEELGQPDVVVGYVLSGAGAGGVLGAVLVGTLRRRLGFGACWIGATGVSAVALGSIGFVRNLVVLGVVAGAYTFGVTVAGTCSMSLRQQMTPGHLLGRVTSAFWTLHYALGPVGAVVLTAFAAGYGVRVAALVAGVGMLGIVGVALFTPVRAVRPEG
ncbi:MFS transporter [Longispora sp. K20-0274]|uniref:MFS transporter n=1 Tax=Longispora sp. K20-0274 TaxID=3088255 RepID=UPI00399B50B7